MILFLREVGIFCTTAMQNKRYTMPCLSSLRCISLKLRTLTQLMSTLQLNQNIILNFDRNICILSYFIFSLNFKFVNVEQLCILIFQGILSFFGWAFWLIWCQFYSFKWLTRCPLNSCLSHFPLDMNDRLWRKCLLPLKKIMSIT